MTEVAECGLAFLVLPSPLPRRHLDGLGRHDSVGAVLPIDRPGKVAVCYVQPAMNGTKPLPVSVAVVKLY